MRAWIDYGERELQVFFWRTRAGSEVDFVLYGRGGFFAIEVKNAPRVRGDDLRGLRAFAEDYPGARRLLLYRGKDALLIDGIPCTPVEQFLRKLEPRRELPFAR